MHWVSRFSKQLNTVGCYENKDSQKQRNDSKSEELQDKRINEENGSKFKKKRKILN